MSKPNIEITELDQLRDRYKAAVEQWVVTIRTEENLATPDHTVHAIDVWEKAGFAEEEARAKAKEARRLYEDGLRQVDFHF
jgi:predicted RNase H-like HicB family nuclease